VFRKYGVTNADSLPVNLGGIVGAVGERLSAETYIKHYNELTGLYRKQNAVSKWMGYVNPFMMLKHNSMALAASDFESYIYFQQQAESYRYKLAQRMNELQTKYITNIKPSEGTHLLQVHKEKFNELEDFAYSFFPLKQTVGKEMWSFLALLFWLCISVLSLVYVSKTFKIIAA
jgi:ABC-2 type transport system permease protein